MTNVRLTIIPMQIAGRKNLRTTVRIVSVLCITVAFEGLYLDQSQKVNTSDILIIIL